MSLTPGIELRELFGSESADTPAARSTSPAIADPVIDELIEQDRSRPRPARSWTSASAPSTACSAHMHIRVPNWYAGKYLRSPTGTCFRQPGRAAALRARRHGIWWVDQAEVRQAEGRGRAALTSTGTAA